MSDLIVRNLERADDAARRRRERWLRAALGEDARSLRRAGAATVGAGALLTVQLPVLALVLDAVLISKKTAFEIPWMALSMLAGAMALRAWLAWFGERTAADASERVKQRLRAALYRLLQSKGPIWLRDQRSGALAGVVADHVDAVDGYYARYWPVRIEAMWVPPILLAVAFWFDWVIGLILLITMPLVPVFMMLVGWGAESAGRRHLEALRRMSGHFADRLRGLTTLRLYGRGEAELAAIGDSADGVRRNLMGVLRIAFLSSAVLEFFASVSVALVALYAGLSLLGEIDLRSTPMTLGAALACLLIAPEFYAPLRRLAAHYHDRAAALAAAGDLETLLGELPGLDAVPRVPVRVWLDQVVIAGHVPPDGRRHGDADLRDCGAPVSAGDADVPPAVDVSQLGFRYPGASHSVLDAITFSLPAGGRLAIMGPSGCGKTTLLELLLGWRAPAAGCVRIDGIDPAGPVVARITVGYVSQRPFLFQGSVLENIRFARPSASLDEVMAAADLANVSAFARRLPDGLDTPVGERGFGLSGGEARRIGLARAMLQSPGLLLLDEPTAFLDSATEAAVLRGLDRFAQGRTLILVTHSEAAARVADRTLWLPEGSLVSVTPQRADRPAPLCASACIDEAEECHERVA